MIGITVQYLYQARTTVLLIWLIMSVTERAITQRLFLGEDLLNGRDKNTLPFEYKGGFILIDVNFNNLIPLKFIFDTGAANTILFDSYFPEIFGATYEDTIAVRGADLHNYIEGYIVRNGIFHLPKLQTKVTRDYITLSENHVKLEETLGIPIGGILGSDFFKRLTVRIDYCRKKITLYDPDNLSIDTSKWTKTSFLSVNGKPYITTTLDLGNTKTKAQLLLDTGASTTVILHTNEDMGISQPDSLIRGYLGTGLGGSILGHIGLLNSLNIAEYTFSDIIVNFQTVNEDSITSHQLRGQGILGNLLLQKFDIIIDYIHSTIYLRQNKHFNNKVKQDRSGLIVHAYGAELNQYVVEFVLPNSPAAKAGILKGDKITKVGNCMSTKHKLHELLTKLQGKPGKRLQVEVIRDKTKITTQLTLQDLFKKST